MWAFRVRHGRVKLLGDFFATTNDGFLRVCPCSSLVLNLPSCREPVRVCYHSCSCFWHKFVNSALILWPIVLAQNTDVGSRSSQVDVSLRFIIACIWQCFSGSSLHTFRTNVCAQFHFLGMVYHALWTLACVPRAHKFLYLEITSRMQRLAKALLPYIMGSLQELLMIICFLQSGCNWLRASRF